MEDEMSKPVVAVVGRPNVGKSTLISVVSEAKPIIANYHFTTITPVLGVVRMGEESSFVMADMLNPTLISPLDGRIPYRIGQKSEPFDCWLIIQTCFSSPSASSCIAFTRSS